MRHKEKERLESRGLRIQLIALGTQVEHFTPMRWLAGLQQQFTTAICHMRSAFIGAVQDRESKACLIEDGEGKRNLWAEDLVTIGCLRRVLRCAGLWVRMPLDRLWLKRLGELKE